MKKINIPLIAGIFIVLTLAAVSFFPDIFTNADPYSMLSVFVDKSGEMHSAPYPPSVIRPLGTDELGRNVYSQIIYGTSQTMTIVLIAAAAILLLSFPLGMAAGFGSKPGIWLLSVANITSSAIPALLLCVVILNLPSISSLNRESSLYAFSLVIAAVGFGRMGTLIRHRVEFILSQPFIEGQVVMGKNRLQLAFQNVLPHLLPDIMVYLSLEAGRTLFLLCQLGVFNIFVGNLRFEDTKETLGRSVAYEPEWGTLLGTTIKLFKVYPWLVFPLIAAFFFGILGFNLLAEGLRTEFEKKNSHFINSVKKIPYFLSPRMFVKDVRQIPGRPLPGLIKLAVVTVLLLAVFFPRQFAYYPFDYKAAFNEIRELSSDKYEGRRSGTAGRDLAAELIETELREAGIEPGGSSGFYNEFRLDDNRMITKQSLSISFDGESYEELKPGTDYRVMNFEPVSYSGEADILSEARIPSDGGDSAGGNPVSIFMTEKTGKWNFAIMMDRISKNKAAVFTVSPEDFSGLSMESDINYANIGIPVIQLSGKWKNNLQNREKTYVRIVIQTARSESPTGKNIVGIIPGTEDSAKDGFIVVGASYDGIGRQSSECPGTFEGASPASISLEAAKAIMLKGKPRKTVVFMFWDYSDRYSCGAYEAGRFSGLDGSEGNLYIDLKYIGSGKQVLIDSSRNSGITPEARHFTSLLKNEYKRLGMRVEMGAVQSPEADAMRQRDMSSVVIEAVESSDIIKTANDNTGLLTEENVKYNGQALLNALIKLIY